MCIKTQTSRFTGSSWAQLERLAAALQEADAVLVGRGGRAFHLRGVCLLRGAVPPLLSGTLRQAYGFHDMYSGGFYPFAQPWRSTGPTGAGISSSTATATAPKPVYQNLLELIKDKDYFCAHHQCGPLLSKGRV